MSELRFEDVAAELDWDGGLRDVLLLETTAAEWQAAFATVVDGPWPTQLKLNDVEAESVRDTDVRELLHGEETALLSVDVAGAIFNCHFFGDNEIEFDVWPTEVTHANFEEVLRFIRAVAVASNRNAYFAHESGPPGSIFGYRLDADRFEVLSRPASRTPLGEQLRERLAPLIALFPRSPQGWVAAAQSLQGEAGAAWEALYHPDQWNWHTDLTNSEYQALRRCDNAVHLVKAINREDGPPIPEAQVRSAGEEFWKSFAAVVKEFDIEPEAPQ